MKVDPVTESAAHAQANAFEPWPKGEVDFECVSAVDGVSKNGNDMTELEHFIFNKSGQRRRVKDWLVNSEGVAYKVRHFAASVGMLAQYEKGELPAIDLPGKTGRLTIGIERGKPDGKGGKYPDRNVVQDYVPKGGKIVGSAAPADMNDEIPF